MKNFFLLLFVIVLVFPLAAQKEPLNAMSLNGATGIYVVPTARVGFTDAQMGFNFGYHTNIFKPFNGETEPNHLLQANLSLLRMIELSGTFDIQPKMYNDDKPNDLIFGGKFQLPFGSVPIAFGGNFQHRNLGKDHVPHWAVQIYGAITYQSELFSWPAETTLVIGHTFVEEGNHSDIDYGMGFDLIVLPKYLGNFLHFLIDYANFSYSADPWGADAGRRGVFNTGLRLDLAQIPGLQKFTFAIDAFVADAFDSRDRGFGRSFGLGATFGMRL